MASSIYEQYGSTAVEAQTFTYEWRIEDFRLLTQENGESISSSIFHAKDNDEVKWRLELYPQGDEEGDHRVTLFLELVSQDAEKTEIKVNCELSISKPESLVWKSTFTYTYSKRGAYGCVEIIDKSELLNSSGSSSPVIIRCKVDIPQRIITKPVKPMSFSSDEGQLNEHFSALLGDARFSDVTIIVGRKKFTAHKLILAARSTVFAAMFEHKTMEENRKNEVKIKDLEAAEVQGMLEFLYTDEVTDLEVLARGLLRASDKYDLQRLRWMCEEVLYKNLTTDNAAEILVLSDLYHSCKLKKCVMAFIDGHLPSVVQSESYKSMVTEHPELLNELMCSIAVRREQRA